jgi:hypothetical protein
MTRPFYAYLLAILVAPFLFGQTQITPPEVVQTGFAVVTPVTGSGFGLSVTETFSEQAGGALFQATVLPSPLATITTVVVNTNPATGANTGVAIVNPNDSVATVTLSLRDQGGNTLSTRTITVAGRTQIPRFVTELFSGTPELAAPFTGSLVVNSDLATGVLGLQFVGPSFTALPTSVQLAGVTTFAAGNVAATTVVISGTGVASPTTATIPTITIPSTPTVPISTVPIPSTIPVTTIPSPTIPATTVPATVTVTPQTFAIGTTTQSPAAFGTPVTNTTVIGTTPNSTVVASAGVVGLGAFLLPQVATGAGWESQVTVANTSVNAQVIRVDFFNANGGPLVIPIGSTISGVTIPPGGVVTFPTGP